MPSHLQSRLIQPRKRSLIRQRLRAALTHLVALLREFRTPILGFLVLTILGGFAYGEIYEAIRGKHIALVDRPYVMLQLMLLEAPEEVPPEIPLVVFWYVLPAAFVGLLGLGAADFLDLFFNRDDNRDRWGEALAMTYRNHAIVLGAGHVGLRVVRDLHDMGLDVVVIDHEPDNDARDVLDRLGIPLVMGDAHVGSTYEHAGLANAEVFVACTGADWVNLEAAMKVRQLQPQVRVVARVWDRALGDRMAQFGMADSVMSAADLSAPAFAGAALGIEITQTLEVQGREYSSARLTVEAGSFLDGSRVGDVEQRNDMEVVLVGEGGDVRVDPAADTELKAGQEVVVFAEHGRVLDVVTRNRRGRR